MQCVRNLKTGTYQTSLVTAPPPAVSLHGSHSLDDSKQWEYANEPHLRQMASRIRRVGPAFTHAPTRHQAPTALLFVMPYFSFDRYISSVRFKERDKTFSTRPYRCGNLVLEGGEPNILSEGLCV